MAVSLKEVLARAQAPRFDYSRAGERIQTARGPGTVVYGYATRSGPRIYVRLDGGSYLAFDADGRS